MGIIAVCIPSVWMVVVSKAPEAFLRSAQSVISLASLGSRQSRKSQERLPSKTLQSNASNASHIPITESSADAYEMNSMQNKNPESVPASRIHVRHSVEQAFASNNKHEVV